MNIRHIRQRLGRLVRRWKPASPAADIRRARRGGKGDYFYLGPDLALKRLCNGLLLYVDPQDEQISANIIADGFWETWVHAVVQGIVRPGDRILEIGGNVGYYTIAMAALAGSKGSVTVLEGNPRLAGLIEKSVRLNGFDHRVQVVAKAALDAPGEIDFVTSRIFSGGGFVSQWDLRPYEDTVVLKVPAVRLDDIVTEPVDLIRIDAEGSEPLILKGAERLLRENADITIIMEWSPIQIAARTPLETFLNWLTSFGFKAWRITHDGRIEPIEMDVLSETAACDLVLSRKASILPKRYVA